MLPVYSLSNALFWGNFGEHVKAAKEGSGCLNAFIHICIATAEFLPIISQIISLAETLLIKGLWHIKESTCLKGRVKKNRPTPIPIRPILIKPITESTRREAEELYHHFKIDQIFQGDPHFDFSVRNYLDLLSMITSLTPDHQLKTLLFAILIAILGDIPSFLQQLFMLRDTLDFEGGTLSKTEVQDLITLWVFELYKVLKEKNSVIIKEKSQKPFEKEKKACLVINYLDMQSFFYQNKKLSMKELHKFASKSEKRPQNDDSPLKTVGLNDLLNKLQPSST